MDIKMNREIIASEAEFKNWFEKNFKNVGYSKIIKDNKGRFPDFTMLKENKKVGVELETVSSNFILHKHDLKKVDELVCIEEDIKIPITTTVINQLRYESRIERISATVDKKTKEMIGLILKKRKYRNISHVIERAIEVLFKEEKNEK